MDEKIMREAGFGENFDLVQVGKCGICAKEVKIGSFRNQISLEEYQISGICQGCQDSVFGED